VGHQYIVGNKGIKELEKGSFGSIVNLSSKLSILIWFLDKGKKAIYKGWW